MDVACHAGAEKVAHPLGGCIEEHWMDKDFVVFKVDMRNTLNMVSRQAVLDQCATSFLELLPWVLWCYGTHPLLWHPLGRISSKSGVQQAWMQMMSVLWALHLIEDLGPALGLHVNLAKCELFSRRSNTSFPPEVRCFLLPNLDILGAPIGNYLHCFMFIAGKCAESRRLLSGLGDVAAVDLQQLRVTPPSLAPDALSSFDEEVKQCFAMCSAINVTDDAWSQAQLRPKFGGLGLCSVSHHAAAAFIASLSFSGLGCADNIHLQQAVAVFNTQVLSGMIQAQHFHIFLESSSPANRARLLSVAAPHASSWLSVVPSPGLSLHLEHGGDVVIHRNCLRDEVIRHLLSCPPKPSDILIAGWDRGKPVALDLTITSPLCSAILSESCHQLRLISSTQMVPNAKSWAGPAF
ncbi:hypothetical protein EMCRGX_G025985 [Ephydatia muelleri]